VKQIEAQNLKAAGIVHGFFGREGGVSEGIYASLNCGPGSRDDPAAVVENRTRVQTMLGGESLLSLSQVHSAVVHTMPMWDARPAPPREGAARFEGDGMVTATPGLALGILTADCAPVLFADRKARVIGAAHAGWKGAHAGVLEATLDAMEKLGAARAGISAAIGPCISQQNYEVGFDFRDRFLEQGLRMRKFFAPSDKEGHYRFDLEGYVAHRLLAAGTGSVEKLGVCTYPPEKGFFSFRRATHAGEPDYGRQISAIVLTG
jgi:YfiH family protein